ncbi:MAG: hypothetical protein U0270_28745 [Labilithrix sp.]
MNRAAAEVALVKLSRQFEGAWRKRRERAFLGAVTFETENTTYRFIDGIFVGRAPRNRTGFPVWDTPSWMKGVELLGFLFEERGCWSVSAEWREGALAVITTLSRGLTLTSPTVDFDQHEPTAPTVPSFNPPLRRSA